MYYMVIAHLSSILWDKGYQVIVYVFSPSTFLFLTVSRNTWPIVWTRHNSRRTALQIFLSERSCYDTTKYINREREGDTHTENETHRETETDTDRERDIETERHRHRRKQREEHIQRKTYTQRDRDIYRVHDVKSADMMLENICIYAFVKMI